MRRIIVLLALLIILGVGAWQIGNRLSTDAVGMGIGLVLGVLAGVPAALLVLATAGVRRNDDQAAEAWNDGYRAGIRETNALALGTRPQTADDGKFSAEWMERMRAQRNAPAVIVVAQPAQHYTPARPFDIIAAERCATWQRCPDCGWPMQPDEHCPDWCGVPAHGRRFAIVGEVEQ